MPVTERLLRANKDFFPFALRECVISENAGVVCGGSVLSGASERESKRVTKQENDRDNGFDMADFKVVLHLLPKISMSCALSQN